MRDIKALTAKVEALKAAPECCAELKEACENWLKAVGTDDEKSASAELLKEIEADITSIDGLIEFVTSKAGEEKLGAEKAAAFATAAKKAKEEGRTVCLCSACTICADILAFREWLC